MNRFFEKPMSPEEHAVLALLYHGFVQENGERMTQREIAASEKWMGAVEEYEKVPHDIETTLRKVRQVIRSLRIVHKAPILSDKNGYWIPSSELEVNEYLERLELEAKAQSKAWFETYGAMKTAFGVQSLYFEKQSSLL